MLTATNLKVKIAEKEIIKGLNLNINPGEIHVLMGPNGSGKSTLAQAIMGHPNYEVSDGNISFDNKNILDLQSHERSLLGIFLSFQYPSEIEGISVSNYLRLIYNKAHSAQLSPVAFRKLLKEKMEILGMKEDFMSRSLNDGFSGGEKKRMEILQMLVLEPKLAILDEVDSGLDIDALKAVAGAITYLHEKNGMSALVITHYARILKYLEPDYVHVMKDGNIIRSGDKNLAHELEETGYSPSQS